MATVKEMTLEENIKETSIKKDWKFYIKRETKIFYNFWKEIILHPLTTSIIDPETGNVITEEEKESGKKYLYL